MLENEGFRTLKGYPGDGESGLTASMEDYLEMICRLMKSRTVVRGGELAENLHVTPSSATRMIHQLADAGFVSSRRYGYILLTEKGRREGEYLLTRHDILIRFLCALNHSENELEQAEKIEHFLDRRTVANLASLADRLEGGKR